MSQPIYPKRLLIIPPRFIGDCVIAQSLISSIRKQFPLCQIHVLVPATIYNWLETCPDIDEIHTLQPGFQKQLNLIKRLKPDTVLLLRRSLTDALSAFLAGVKNRVGFSSQRIKGKYRNTSFFLTHLSSYPELVSNEPHVKLLASILSHFAIKEFVPTTISYTREDEKLVEFIQEKYGFEKYPFLALHLTSASTEKEMSPEKFVPVVHYLDQLGFKLLAIGSSSERVFYHQLERQSNIEITNLCGETSLRVCALLLSKCHALFSLDSGPVHMAAVSGCPNIIAVYGPTSQTQWAPYPYTGNFTAIFNTQLTCRPCLPKVCEHNLCREGLTDAWILQQVRHHVSKYLPTFVISSS